MKRVPLLVAVALTVAMAMYFSWFDMARHNKTNSSRFDLGNVEQVEWNLIHGRGFVATDPYGTSTISRFAFHADPFLIVLAPLYATFPETSTLLLLQAAAVASGALAVFFIGRKLLSPTWGMMFSLLYVVNPAIHWATIFDVHAVTFATPLILWAAWAAISKKYWWTIVLVVLAMTTKEEIGLGVVLIGLYVWWRQKNMKWGSVLTFVPLIWSLLMFFVVLPHFRHLSAGSGEVYQTVFGTGAKEAMMGLLQRPLKFFHQLLAHQNLTMAFQLLAPLGFLPLLSWWSFGALPDYSINALSLKPAQHLIMSHYTSGLTPWLFVGLIMTITWLVKTVWPKLKLDHDRRTLTFALVVWLLGWSGYSAWAVGPLPGAKHDNSPVATWHNDYAAPVARWEEIIPTSASVSVTNNVGSHFAWREHFYSFPLGVEQSDYVVVLEGHATPVVAAQDQVITRVSQLKNDPNWQVLEKRGDLTVLRRRE